MKALGVCTRFVLFVLVVSLPGCRGSTGPVPHSVWTTLAASEHYTCGLFPEAQAFWPR